MIQHSPPSLSDAVPFFTTQGMSFDVDLAACIQRVLEQGQFVLGPQVQAFETAFADYVGAAHAIGVANGTDALTLALRALGVGPGQCVVAAANAGYYASTAIAQTGATTRSEERRVGKECRSRWSPDH